MINQFKLCHWETFSQWVDRQQERKLLILKEGEKADSITYLHFNYRPHARHGRGEYSKADVYLALAELIKAIGGSSGLEHNLMVLYRYISSQDHSNLCVDYKALKRQISSIFGEEKVGRNNLLFSVNNVKDTGLEKQISSLFRKFAHTKSI